MKLVHWPLMYRLLHLVVTFGTARRGLGGAAARPGPSLASVPITVFLYNDSLLCTFRGLTGCKNVRHGELEIVNESNVCCLLVQSRIV